MTGASSASERERSTSRVFVVTGPSGVGKGTLIARLLELVPELELSISATTRAPRQGERDGLEYHFLEPGEFERRVRDGDFLEHATYSGHRYGTLRSEVDRRLAAGRSVVLEIEVQGARQVREAMPESVQVFIAPPDPAALRDRLEGRGTDTQEQIARRLQTAEEELRAEADFDHRVVNENMERAVGELEGIVRAEIGGPG